MTDAYSGYDFLEKLAAINFVLCWAHVRRDFVKVGKGWEESKEWAVAWLRRIRTLYRQHHQRRNHAVGSVEFAAADAAAIRSRVAKPHKAIALVYPRPEN